MSEQMWWTRDAEGKKHPDDAVLFAFMRESLSEQDRQEVYRHLGECMQCWNYCRVGRLINKMQPTYEANESIADAVMEYINNPASERLKRQSKPLHRLPGDMPDTTRRLPGRPMKRPLLIYGLALLLLVILVIVALAYKGTGKSSNFKSSSSTNYATSSSTVSITSQADTPTPAPTHAAGPNISVAAIHLCGTSPGKYQERIDICGSHFHPGDKLELVVYVAGGQPRPYRTLVVNAQGQFQTFLALTPCRETIQAIYMQDLTNRAVSSNIIKDIQGRCELSPSG
jgi:hypothetical protein